MSQNVRLTISPEIEKALEILRTSTSGALNTTELIKLAVGELAHIKLREQQLESERVGQGSSRLFSEWARHDGSIDDDIIAEPDKLKPYTL